jgi:hypothetical protein
LLQPSSSSSFIVFGEPKAIHVNPVHTKKATPPLRMRNQKPEEKKILSIFSDEEKPKTKKKSLTSLVWGEDFCPLSAQFHPSLHTRTHTRRLIGIHVVSLTQNSPPDQPIGFISPFFFPLF